MITSRQLRQRATATLLHWAVYRRHSLPDNLPSWNVQLYRNEYNRAMTRLQFTRLYTELRSATDCVTKAGELFTLRRRAKIGNNSVGERLSGEHRRLSGGHVIARLGHQWLMDNRWRRRRRMCASDHVAARIRWSMVINGWLEWLACWTQAQKGLGSNRSRDAVLGKLFTPIAPLFTELRNW